MLLAYVLVIWVGLVDATDRYQALLSEYRCLVCQGQSLQDSHSPFAESVKTYIKQQIAAGVSDQAIDAYLLSRYGREIKANARVEDHLSLWLLPGVLVAILALRFYQLHRKIQS